MYLFQLVIILSVFDSNTATAVGAGAFAATAVGAGAFAATAVGAGAFAATTAVSSCFLNISSLCCYYCCFCC
jgi:hypothetical protein